ncbi:MAG: DUF2752 domain-containing protein [Oscillospiraceae bacterium]
MKLAIVIFAIVYFLVYLSWGCPIRNFFGVPCPACGLTHATLAALHGDFVGAFHYHPLFFLPYLVILAAILYHVLTRRKKRGKAFHGIFIAFFALSLLLFIVVYLYRLSVIPQFRH